MPALPVDDDPGACSVPRSGGWRPGARWARSDVEADIASLPTHRQPPMRELGRRSEAAQHPFRGAVSGNVPPLTSPIPAVPMAAPLILTEQIGQKLVVAAACSQAAALGLEIGMPVAQARALYADLDIRPHDAEADANLLARFALHAAIRWTPIAMPTHPGGLLLDLSGTSHLFGGEERFCARVIRYYRRLGFTAAIAIADTPGAAHALARFSRDVITIVPAGGTAQAIAPLPIAALRLEPQALDAARRFGLTRVADLLGLPRAPLARRLGRAAIERLDQALGRVGEPLDPVVPAELIQAERRLLEPISTAEAITQVCGDLVRDLVRGLRERGLGARGIRLSCLRVDGTDQYLSFGTARATREPAHLLRLLALRIDRIDPGFGIEVLRLAALRTDALAATALGAVLTGDEPAGDVADVVDQLAGRVGSASIFRTAPLESDVPERAVERISPLAATGGWPSYKRPARLLARPEPISRVVALLPDAPPRRFEWRGTTHRVVAGDGPERIHGEWWRRSGEVWAVHDYFRVEDEAGARFWLFRRGDGVDADTGDLSWYMHGLFG